MFRARSPQGSLFESEFLLPPKKVERLKKSWAEPFRTKALPLIDEERFAGMYDPGIGRPNRAVEIVLGFHILKDMQDLTDEEALEQLEFHHLWHHALRLTAEEAHLSEKTVYNFRERLMIHDGGRLAFQETTDKILDVLGIRTGKQRLDSTHILSNMAVLTRLGLFCETMRVFLWAVRKEHPELAHLIPGALARRYVDEEDEPTFYEDARSRESRRRLAVCARDLYRLVEAFRGTKAAKLEEYGLMKRLLREQCRVSRRGGGDGAPGDDDDDAGEGRAPVSLKAPEEVRSDSLQSPHDPDATYSGHKGQGYEVQVAETCDEGNPVQIITHVETTPSSQSDTHVTLFLIEGLSEREIQPEELYADTAYGSGRNAFEAERQGTEVVSPVGGPSPKTATERAPQTEETEGEEEEEAPSRLTAADFEIDPAAERPALCPAGHEAIAEYQDEEAPERVEIVFPDRACKPCPMRARCPVRWRWPDLLPRRTRPVFSVRANLVEVNIQRRRRAEATDAWRERYAIRAGIEGTNSEMKRTHGLGKLRVRGGARVHLAVYLKALACNMKRMIRALQRQEAAPPPADRGPIHPVNTSPMAVAA